MQLHDAHLAARMPSILEVKQMGGEITGKMVIPPSFFNIKA
ncbi:hypothetical protein [Blautia glucerasea]|nr:hypothetical protein [Blautia glucerasea]